MKLVLSSLWKKVLTKEIIDKILKWKNLSYTHSHTLLTRNQGHLTFVTMIWALQGFKLCQFVPEFNDRKGNNL